MFVAPEYESPVKQLKHTNASSVSTSNNENLTKLRNINDEVDDSGNVVIVEKSQTEYPKEDESKKEEKKTKKKMNFSGKRR